MTMDQSYQQLQFLQHPLQIVNLTFTTTSAKITVGGIRSILISWRGGQVIIKQIWRARLSWRSRPTPVLWPYIAGLASRAWLAPRIWRPWRIWLAIITGGVVAGGYAC